MGSDRADTSLRPCRTVYLCLYYLACLQQHQVIAFPVAVRTLPAILVYSAESI